MSEAILAVTPSREERKKTKKTKKKKKDKKKRKQREQEASAEANQPYDQERKKKKRKKQQQQQHDENESSHHTPDDILEETTTRQEQQEYGSKSAVSQHDHSSRTISGLESQTESDRENSSKLTSNLTAADRQEDANQLALMQQKQQQQQQNKSKKKKRKKKDRRIKTATSREASESKESSSNHSEAEVVTTSKSQTTGDKETPQKSSICPGTNSESEKPEATFPFPTDPDDHCESPLQAYSHIQSFLQYLEQTLPKNGRKRSLQIYDPYYCNGAVKENLKELGFPDVYNRKEDCYQVWNNASRSSSYPEYDVMVTNPPYSGNHVEKLIHHIVTTQNKQPSGVPFFLLLPEWVHKKDYYQQAIADANIQPFYLVPHKRYIYLPPKDYRAAKKSDTHKKSSPFPSMWYIWGGSSQMNDRLLRHFHGGNCRYQEPSSAGDSEPAPASNKPRFLSEVCDVARSKSALRDLRRKHKKR